SAVATRTHQVDLALAVMRQLFEGRLQRMRSLLSNFVHASSVFEKTFTTMRERVASFMRLVKNLGPEATLKRGYTMTLHKGKIIRSAHAVARGAELATRFTDGEVISEVI
ncbi:MAG: exodeoxyribonuclease VII large subunit, partial [bacterium]|nr:exodeoxyribonuclease VII large subunit [bacterium]